MSDESAAVQMPANWDDHEGWNAYYHASPAIGKPLGSHTELGGLSGVVSTGKYLVSVGKEKLWIPGCGVSPVPQICAALGLKVWATDVSETAIQIQQNWPSYAEWAPRLLASQKHLAVDPQDLSANGELHLLVHDFRTPFEESAFDWIFNIKAFQALPPESMAKAATVHWAALKPGGGANFSTMNVQGSLRTRLEAALVAAGFHVPYHEIQKWYRLQLDSTGIDYVMILNRPLVRGVIDSPDQKRLDQFSEPYAQRIQEENPRLQAIMEDEVTKIAWVSYSTG